MRLKKLALLLTVALVSNLGAIHSAFSQLNPHFCKNPQSVGRLAYICSVDNKCSELNGQLDQIDDFIRGDSLKNINQRCSRSCAKKEVCSDDRQCQKSCRQSCVWETLSNPLMSAISAYHSDCKASLKISKCATKEAKPFCNLMSLKALAEDSFRPKSGKDYARIRSIYKKTSKKYRIRCDGIWQEAHAASMEIREIINTHYNCEVLEPHYNICNDAGLWNRPAHEDLGELANSLVPLYQNVASFKCQPTPLPPAAVGCKQATSCSAERDDIIYTDLDGKACYCDQVCCSQFSDCCSNFANECSATVGGNICSSTTSAAGALPKSLRGRF